MELFYLSELIEDYRDTRSTKTESNVPHSLRMIGVFQILLAVRKEGRRHRRHFLPQFAADGEGKVSREPPGRGFGD
jgi:hypothetical protein